MSVSLRIGLWNAWIFMSVFIFQMIVMFLQRQTSKSHVPIKAKRNKLERTIAYIANLIWFIALIYSIFLPFHVKSPWFIVGLVIFIIGLIFLIRASFDFLTTPKDKLINKGIYRISRHPMYLATFFICMGAGISTLSCIFLFLSIIMAICFYQESLIEERYCLEIFADEYKEYMSKTRRIIGILKR